MKIISIITNNSKCGANFVHYMLASTVSNWKVVSFRGGNNKLYDLSIKTLMKSRLFLIFRQRTILKELEKELVDVDVVVSDGLISYYYVKRLSKNNPKIKYYALVHNDYTIDNRTNWNFLPNFIFNFIYDSLLKDFTVITTSDAAYTSLTARGLSIIPIDNGVLKPIISSGESCAEIVNYWYIGRLTKIKQVDMLVRAFSSLPIYCRLNIVGDGEQKNLLLELCESLNIKYKYWGQRENPFYYTSKGDIFVLPSLVEGRSIALMEAMLSGCFCIVSNIDANKDFINYGAITFDVLSESDLADKLFFSSELTLDERIRFSNVTKAEQDFSVNKMAKKYLELFNE